MSISGRLVQGFRARVGRSLAPEFISNAKAYELYQGYVFGIILSAAWNEGASVFTKDAFGTTNPPRLLFRRSPGEIYGTTGPYAHAILEFPDKPLLEVHVSIMVRGISQVSHECDVCVLYKEEADRCRTAMRDPECSQLLIAAECKQYDSPLKLDLARSFIGLASELQVEGDCYFIASGFSGSVAKLLATRRLKWEHNITPGATNELNRLRYAFQNNFKDFKARH